MRFSDAFCKRFPLHWLSYVLQSLLASISIFLVLMALRQQNLVVAASLAATAFTVFTMPGSITSSTRNVPGGHAYGLLFGSVFVLVSLKSAIMQNAMYALGFSWNIVLGVLTGVGLLALIHRLLRPYLRDLIAEPEGVRNGKP
jgi:drug/metabolite transporter superfamily protein YnfA